MWRILAAVLGAWLALWLLGGDRTPEAADLTSIDVTITRYYVKDGVEFYRIGDGVGSGVLSVDSDTPLAAWLRVHKKATVR